MTTAPSDFIDWFFHPMGTVYVLAYSPGTPAVTHARPEDCDPSDPAECDFLVFDAADTLLTLTTGEEDLIVDAVCQRMEGKAHGY